MSQVSRVNLPGIIQKELSDQFSWVISQFKNQEEVEGFLSELLTKTEKIMFVKRLAIALLLTKGYTYRDIRFLLHVSFPTIRSVQFWLDHGGKGYRAAIAKIMERQTLKNFLKSLDKLADKQSSEQQKKNSISQGS